MKIQTFSVVVGTAACNARCPFCISKMTGKELGFVEPEVNWRNFEKACRLAQVNYVSTVLLTGKGEPTLYPKQVTGFLEHMKPYDFPLIEMQTNALVFEKQFEQYRKHLKDWYDLGLNTMAISVVHYDREKNREIYTPKGEYMDLEGVIKRLQDYGYSTRLCCMMAKDYIDSPKEVENLIDFSRKNGVEQLTVRPITTTTEDSECKEVYEWTKKHALSKKQVDAINRHVERNAHKIMTLNFGATVYDFNGQNIATSNCLTIKPDSDEIRQLIFFPDGHLRYDWQYKGAVLM